MAAMLLHKIAFILYLRLGFYFFQIFAHFCIDFLINFDEVKITFLEFHELKFKLSTFLTFSRLYQFIFSKDFIVKFYDRLSISKN